MQEVRPASLLVAVYILQASDRLAGLSLIPGMILMFRIDIV
jgi:hypothetical protein